MTRRGHYLAALANIFHSQLNEYSVFLWTLPLFHCNGWCFPWAIIATGGCNILLEKVMTFIHKCLLTVPKLG